MLQDALDQAKHDFIRTDYYAIEQLRRCGAALAREESTRLPGYSRFDLIRRQKDNKQLITAVYQSVFKSAEAKELITPAGEWLIDNFYLIEDNIRQVWLSLPSRFVRQLPALEVSEEGTLPRTMALAWLYVSRSHCEVNASRLTAMVEGYQTERPFQIGELWAIPSFLRFVLIEDLRRLAARFEEAGNLREQANVTADRLIATDSGAARAALLQTIRPMADNDTFASQLLYRLRDVSMKAQETLIWLEDCFEARDSDAEEVLIAEQNRLSAENVRIGNIVSSLRSIDDLDWTKWFVKVSAVDALLRDRSNFGRLDFTSQDQYRNAIELLARQSPASELEVTEQALQLNDLETRQDETAKRLQIADVGQYFVGNKRPLLEQKIGCHLPPLMRMQRWYGKLGWWSISLPISLLTLLTLVAAFITLQSIGVGALPALVLSLLATLPASEAATGLFHTLVTYLKSPSRLVGFELKDGLSAAEKTLLVIPCLLSSRDSVDELVRSLEVHYLANPAGEIYFALASDWPDSDEEINAADEVLLTYARQEINVLSERYAHDGRTRFFLLHRNRMFNAAEDCWMGWERKRGKLLELNLLLRGDQDTSYLPTAEPLPAAVEYVMTLDADTRLTRDAVTTLVGKLSHPMNKPVIDPVAGRVVSGHAILQPRVTAPLTSGKESSAFQKIFSQYSGLDPYVFTVSDVYQDLTGEGSYTGKGLYHVDTFTSILHDKFAENTVLSHDLIEGALVRSALVTDVELIEDFPVRYAVEAARQHRWARGDWQLLPAIFSVDPALNALGRWKMLDNLRRSLVPIAWLLASVMGWCLLTFDRALLWQSFLVVSLFVAPTLGLIKGLFPGQADSVMRAHFYSVTHESLAMSAQVLLRIIFIAHTAALMMDAMLRSLYRVYVSHRHLLEWRTADQTVAGAHETLFDYYKSMRIAGGIALLALLATIATGSEALGLALLFCVLWAISPWFAWLVSRSAETEDKLDVSDDDRIELRKIARRTWLYFETFVTAEHHMLPPDNFQETPQPVVANRTSPTNIGVYLLSIVCARYCGWISMAHTVSRLQATLATVNRMQKYRGHLYNWYDTKTLQPLLPQYISSVDSGNLAGHLIALSSACKDWAEAPFAYLHASLDGIIDAAGILQEELETVPDDRRSIRPLRKRLKDNIAGFKQATLAIAREPEFASVRAPDLYTMARDIEKLAGELDHGIGSEQSRSVADWACRLKETCEADLDDMELDQQPMEELRQSLVQLQVRARTLAFSMDFAFLMRPDRRLLAIGYRPDNNELDDACYDLLASEARLTSLFAIAKGDLPTEHWFRLGRPIVPVGSLGALVSWSGSMFEYLMPTLVMREQRGSILNRTNALVVTRQIEYGRQRNIPWGISESALNARDREMTYQYSNFGVPSLGMKRGLALDLVVAPYATLLASQFQPGAAVVNLRRLRRLGALGVYGFYDALDFTPSRLPDNVKSVVVRNYMAHHHGMSILAVSNVVFEGRLREQFHSDQVIEAAELLLQEKAPREVPVLTTRQMTNEPLAGRSELPSPAHRIIDDPLRQEAAIALLSNGHYSLMLTARGTGCANWNGLAVTRWKPDPIEDCWGTFLFLRDMETHEWWSASARPRPGKDEKTHAVFSDSKVEFHKTVGSLRSQVDVIVASESDAEGRRITLFNTGEKDRSIEVTSYSEPVLSSSDADTAHPVFSKMFLKTEIGGGGSIIFTQRNKRRPDEPDMQVAHLVVDGSHGRRATQAETDRRKFIGRGRTLATAAAFDAGAELSGSEGFTLDPILSLRYTLRVPAGKQVSLIFWTIAAPSRAELETTVDRYRNRESFEHESMHSWTRSQVQLRYLGMSSAEITVFQQLARYLIFPNDGMRWDSDKEVLAPQSTLWSLGISGDFPIMALRIDAEADFAIVRKALRAQEYFRAHGLLADLVILNEQATSYAQDLQNRIDALCENVRVRGSTAGPREHIFALRRDLTPTHVYAALTATARVTLHARNGRFSVQLKRAERLAAKLRFNADIRTQRKLPRADHPRTPADRSAVATPPDLLFWNGYGGFRADGREYIMRLAGERATPQPWINVIANSRFGFHVSAEGAGFTWSVNSRDYQLTPWSNDPVIDNPGETFFVVERDTKAVFSPLATCTGTHPTQHEARHGPGYSTFVSDSDQLQLELTQLVDPNEAVKLSRLRLTNSSTKTRSLRVFHYVEWVLGNSRAKTAPFIAVHYAATPQLLTASNPYSVEFPDRTAFLACDQPLSSLTANRQEFLGNGSVRQPQSVFLARELSGSTDTKGDPCAAIATDIELAAGTSKDVLFLLGDCLSVTAAEELTQQQRKISFDSRLTATQEEWSSLLDMVQIDTPDIAMNLMVNNWLPYQSIACRMRARAAFYQASGAFGFRDQLQDTLAFLLQDPDFARKQIINAASRQFAEGDVQHWWLPSSGAGVRTLIADDVVWLGYAVNHYLMVTGDDAILDHEIPFLEGQTLLPGQHDAFFTPSVSTHTATLFEHCALALDLAIKRTGAHHLPLILGGDWNDGMNRVGENGKGESVWLGWFLAHVLHAFIPIAEQREASRHDADKRKDATQAAATVATASAESRLATWRKHLQALRAALEDAGWDGDYYRRGYYDDGTPLGSAGSDECKIDSIAQSWSVLSGLGDPQRCNQALDAVLDQLVDADARLLKLFTPPLANTDQEPGYIKSYPPGVRENGGQYTHAATWVVYALAELGRADEALQCFNLLNPVNHARDRDAAETYRVEPYVVAADVYSSADKSGRGGWTWYTGSGGWLYRAAVEGILGIRKQRDSLYIKPALPSSWNGFTARLTLAGELYAIVVERQNDAVVVSVNGERLDNPESAYPLNTTKRSVA